MKLTLLVAALILLCSPGVARSQDAMSPQKRQLIDRLVLATGADKNVGVIFDAFMTGYIQMMPQMDVDSIKSYASAPPEFRKELTVLANNTMKIIATRTKERVLQDEAFRAEQLAIVGRIWNDRFSDDELKEIVAFFETPAGKKLAQAGPAIAIETASKAHEILGPVLSRIFDEVQREELEKLANQVRQLERKHGLNKKPG